ncbi:MAG TPA: cyanophycinase [Flavobacteriaceae bacterium]|nr:cyanophycinase [Flavobacteriaceae bacterium]
MEIKGTLIPIGGDENKGLRIHKKEKYNIEYIEDSILSRVVAESGGKDSLIVIIPTASKIPDEVGQMYLDAFGKLGCSNLEIANIRSREDSGNPKFIDLVKKADCVMFGGGNQSQIIADIAATEIHDILIKKYKNEAFVLAGTSAGAMAMSQEMITGSNPKRVFTKGAVGMGKGLGIIPQLIIDSHFIKRKRFGRLSGAVSRFPNLIGIGLDEDTGLVIKKGNFCEIIGSGMIIILDPRKLTHNNAEEVARGGFVSLSNLITHILAPGDSFDIAKNEIYAAQKYSENA